MGDVGIKICGLNDSASVHACCVHGADFLGFVFYARSPRYVGIETASALADIARKDYDGLFRIVALTVDAEMSYIGRIMDGLRPDYIQMHGHESPSYMRSVIENFGVSVIKAVSVSDVGDIGRMRHYLEDIPVGFEVIPLFDAPPPDEDGLPGGNGRIFDWDVLGGHDFSYFFLSGGLNSANVVSALKHTGSPYVDVSSGVEVRAGVKSPAKIERFISAVRSYGAENGTRDG